MDSLFCLIPEVLLYFRTLHPEWDSVLFPLCLRRGGGWRVMSAWCQVKILKLLILSSFFVKVSHFFFNEKLASAYDRVFFFSIWFRLYWLIMSCPKLLLNPYYPFFILRAFLFYGSGSKKVLYLCDVLVLVNLVRC